MHDRLEEGLDLLDYKEEGILRFASGQFIGGDTKIYVARGHQWMELPIRC
jgi:hypothetical protein